MEDQAEAIKRIVEEDAALEARIEAETRATAHALIQGYLGPDHKVMDMGRFYSALVQALKAARRQGQADASSSVMAIN